MPGKPTNRSRVYLGRDDGRRLIVRCGHVIDFEQDLTPEYCRRRQSLVARSRACLVGNLPVQLTRDLLEWGTRLGTYMSLGAGDRQLAHLANLRPHALFLNRDEARAATGRDCGAPGEVFDSLCRLTTARHVVVMTGGGQEPTSFWRRGEDKLRLLQPEQITVLVRDGGDVNGLGAGDTLAGAATFLLGLPRTLVGGLLAYEAIAFAQSVVTVHLTGDRAAGDLVRKR